MENFIVKIISNPLISFLLGVLFTYLVSWHFSKSSDYVLMTMENEGKIRLKRNWCGKINGYSWVIRPDSVVNESTFHPFEVKQNSDDE